MVCNFKYYLPNCLSLLKSTILPSKGNVLPYNYLWYKCVTTGYRYFPYRHLYHTEYKDRLLTNKFYEIRVSSFENLFLNKAFFKFLKSCVEHNIVTTYKRDYLLTRFCFTNFTKFLKIPLKIV